MLEKATKHSGLMSPDMETMLMRAILAPQLEHELNERIKLATIRIDATGFCVHATHT